MDNIFIENQIDAVIHFAGFKAVSESGAKFLEYHENNMNSTFVLVDVMRFYGCKNISLSSSATFYDDSAMISISVQRGIVLIHTARLSI